MIDALLNFAYSLLIMAFVLGLGTIAVIYVDKHLTTPKKEKHD